MHRELLTAAASASNKRPFGKAFPREKVAGSPQATEACHNWNEGCRYGFRHACEVTDSPDQASSSAAHRMALARIALAPSSRTVPEKGAATAVAANRIISFAGDVTWLMEGNINEIVRKLGRCASA